MNPAQLFVLGATHHAAAIEVREKLALSSDAEIALQQELTSCGAVSELAVLSTCNRVEFYGVAADTAAAAQVEAAFCRRVGFDPAQFARIRLHLTGQKALNHLFAVAAGLDSQMLGENEIFGQVKDAYAAAQTRHCAGPVLNRVFQKTFQAVKHVRTHTAITAGQISVANVAVDLASNIFGELAAVRVLLIGAGEIGEKTARAFQSRGVTSVTIASRTLERSVQLAESLNAGTLPFDHREQRLGDFDIVACATAAPETVLSRAAVQTSMRRRAARPLLLLDLALPRDIEAAAATSSNVFLYNLDDLARIAEENLRAREAEAERCRSLLAERAQRLWQDLATRAGAPMHVTPSDPPPAPGLRGPGSAPQPGHPT